jgi:hypothetical protein
MPESQPNHYVETVRRSYLTLTHMTHALAAQSPTASEAEARRTVDETVAEFLARLVWADGRLVHGETQAIDAILAQDEMANGDLSAAIQAAMAAEPPSGNVTPAFLQQCVAYDRANGTRLTGSAINALESMGLSLLAADREISMDELQILQDLVSRWREDLLTVAPLDFSVSSGDNH